VERKFEQYIGIHPGFVIDRELKRRGIKQRPFALLLSEHPQTFNAITKGKRNLTTRLALKIEKELQIEEGTLVLLQAHYDIRKAKEVDCWSVPDLTIIRKALFWDTDVEHLDWAKNYRAVIQRVFERGDDAEKNEIIRFYGMDKIEQARSSLNIQPMALQQKTRFV
jgi:plasmid maintenance system antidote protein VapI